MSEAIAILLFATMSLQDVVHRAIAHSPELRALEAQVAEARANATLADAFRSSFAVSTTPGYATGLPTAVLGQVPAIGTIEAHRLLYDPSARAEQIGAMSQIDAAVARLESRKREIAQSAAELYARLAADAVLNASAQRRIDAYQTIASQTEALRGEGRVRDLDVDRAALQVASAKRAAFQARSRMELDQLRLDSIVAENVTPHPASGHPLPADAGRGPSRESAAAAGRGPSHESAAAAGRGPSREIPLPLAGEGAAERRVRAETNDPELRSLNARIEALQRAIGPVTRLFQPTVAAQVQYSRLFDRYGRYYLHFKPDDFIVGATVTLPIFTGGRRAATNARVKAQLEQLTALRDARRTELELALREAEADVAQAIAERDLAARAHAVAEENLQVAEELGRQGRGGTNDIPLAQIAVADADDDVANAAAHLAIAQMKLMIVRGDPI